LFILSFFIPHLFVLAGGLAGGWLGVPRDGPLETPSQPPGKTCPILFIGKMDGYRTTDILRLKRKWCRAKPV